MWGVQMPTRKSGLLSLQPTLAIGSILLVFPMTASAVHAQSWTGDTSSDWFDTTNWSTGALPTDSDKDVEVDLDTSILSDPNFPNISDQSSNGAATAEVITIGNADAGVLTIENGGQLTLTSGGYLGFSEGSFGSITVTGSTTVGSTTYLSTLDIGETLIVGNEGSGSLTVADGAQIMSSSTEGDVLFVSFADTSTAQLVVGANIGDTPVAPGLVSVSTIFLQSENGMLVLNHTATSSNPFELASELMASGEGSEIYVASGYTVFSGDGSTYRDTTTIDGGTLAIDLALKSSTLTVGNTGTDASLIVQSGADTSTTGDATIGSQAGSSGTATVSGTSSDGTASSLSVTGDLNVGDAGTGKLIVESGADVAVTGDTYLGNQTGSSGSATVTGTSSGSTASGLSVAGDFYVGSEGTGTLIVSSGAAVEADKGNGTITLAEKSGSTGTVAIGANSGETATAAGSLNVGSLVFGSGTGTLLFNHTATESDAIAYSFALSGNGTVSIEAGYTELSGNTSNFSGIISVDGGTLAVTGDLKADTLNVGDSGSGAAAITNGAVANINDVSVGLSSGVTGTLTVSAAASSGQSSDESTLKAKSLIIGSSGTGTLVINNSGSVVVNDGNGALTVAGSSGSSGTLVIGSQSGDTAQGTGSLSASSVAFGDGTGTALFNLDDTDSYKFSIPFTGSGTIESQSGTTELSADNKGFTGSTIVNGGTLTISNALPGDIVINDGGTLSVTGKVSGAVTINSGGSLNGTGTLSDTLTVNTGGTLSSASTTGTLNTADITFASGGILGVDIDADGKAGRIKSSGTATITGGTVTVTADSYDVDGSFTILTADTAVSGTFSEATGTSSFIDYALSYDDKSVLLTQSVSQSFESVGATENQLAVGAALDSLPTNHDVVQHTFGAMSNAEARAIFDRLSGENQASLKGALMSSGRKISDTVNQRLGGSFQDDTQVFAYGSTNSNSQHGAWIAGYGGWEDIDSTGNTAAADNSYGGIVAGLDHDFGRHWRLGLLGAYGHTETSQSALSSSASADSFSAGAYGQATHGPVFVNFGGLFTWHDIDSSRSVTLRRKSQTLTAGYDATSWQLFSEAGYRIDRGDTRIEPFANLSFMQLDTDGYTETGGSAALTAASDTQSTTFTTLGLRVAQQMTRTVRLHGMAGWRHAFGDTDPSTTFALAGSIPFIVTGAPIAVDALVIQAGFDVEATNNVTFGVAYDGQFGDGSSANQIEGHLRVLF